MAPLTCSACRKLIDVEPPRCPACGARFPYLHEGAWIRSVERAAAVLLALGLGAAAGRAVGRMQPQSAGRPLVIAPPGGPRPAVVPFTNGQLRVRFQVSDPADPLVRFWDVWVDQEPGAYLGAGRYERRPAASQTHVSGDSMDFAIAGTPGNHTLCFVVTQSGGERYGAYSGVAVAGRFELRFENVTAERPIHLGVEIPVDDADLNEATASPVIGGAGGAGFTFVCPQGSYVATFSGRSGTWIDALRAVCSNGTASPLWGGQGGTPWQEDSPAGFQSAAGRGGQYVDQLEFGKPNGAITPSHGGGGGAVVAWRGCPPGSLVVGMLGAVEQYLDSVRFLCRPSR